MVIREPFASTRSRPLYFVDEAACIDCLKIKCALHVGWTFGTKFIHGAAASSLSRLAPEDNVAHTIFT